MASHIVVSSAERENLVLSADTKEKRIKQAILMILTTRRGEVPMDRGCGLKMDWLDKPVTMVAPLIVRDVTESIEDYLESVKVSKVTHSYDEDGRVVIKVEVSIDE